MMTPRGESLARLARAAMPTALGLFGVILLALPLRLFEGLAPTPVIPLVVVYFWTIYGPDYMPAPSVFVIGLLHDFMSGGPLGLWPGIYLVTQYAVLSQRSYFLGREQRVVWMGFSLAVIVAAIILWLVMSLMKGVVQPVWPLLFQMAATIAVYPLFGAGFGHLHRRVVSGV